MTDYEKEKEVRKLTSVIEGLTSEAIAIQVLIDQDYELLKDFTLSYNLCNEIMKRMEGNKAHLKGLNNRIKNCELKISILA